MADRKPILCLDFDGVIHSYTGGWKGADAVLDPPVDGALDFMYEALDHFEIHVFSSRSNQPGGIEAMKDWLHTRAVALLFDGHFNDDPMLCWLDQIRWPTEKPPAMVTLDDRALTFEGTWPPLNELKAFRPWNKRNVTEAHNGPETGSWRDHVDTAEHLTVLEEYDDGSVICLSSYAGGGSNTGLWGSLTLMRVTATGEMTFRDYAALQSDWYPSEVSKTPVRQP